MNKTLKVLFYLKKREDYVSGIHADLLAAYR